MNRRSILSSLSSMCLAALAWPRNAAGGGTGGTKNSTSTFKTKFYNGAWVGNALIPGQATLEVDAYNAYEYTTITAGQIIEKTFSGKASFLQNVVRAKNSQPPGDLSQQIIRQTGGTTLYFLVFASGNGAPTITQAPNGVVF